MNYPFSFLNRMTGWFLYKEVGNAADPILQTGSKLHETRALAQAEADAIGDPEIKVGRLVVTPWLDSHGPRNVFTMRGSQRADNRTWAEFNGSGEAAIERQVNDYRHALKHAVT